MFKNFKDCNSESHLQLKYSKRKKNEKAYSDTLPII